MTMLKVEDVAHLNFEDPASLIDHALNNEDRFGVQVNEGEVWVSSFFVDEMLASFREEGDEYIIDNFFFPDTLGFDLP